VGDSRWKIFGQQGAGIPHRLAGCQRVGARPLEDRNGDGRLVIEIRVGGKVLTGELNPRYVAHAHDGIGGLLDNDVGKLFRVRESTERPHRHLEGELTGHRRLVEHPGCNLHVLALQRLGHVEGGEVERLQPVRIKPDLHGVVARAEHGDRADAIEARQHVLDLDVGVVGDEQLIAAFVR
jgi:hypothetical protein